MKTIAVLVLAALCLAGCHNPVETTAEEGKNAFQTGMRTSEKARDFGAQKESFDRQADEF